MELDIITQLAIIAEEKSAMWQAVLMYCSLFALVAIVAAVCLYKFASVWGKIWKDYLRLDGFGKVAAVVFFCGLAFYGSTKHTRVQNAGADNGITLAYIDYEVTNVVVSADVTNKVTSVDVAWTEGTITTETPVQVRLSQTNEWIVLTKQDASTYLDSTTNHLYFGVAGDKGGYPYWWVGVNPPPIIIEVVGITLTGFVASSHSVFMTWSCDDTRATEYVIEYKNGVNGAWNHVLTTTNKAAQVSGFFIDRTTGWRISSTVQEENNQ